MITVHYVPDFFDPKSATIERCTSLIESLMSKWTRMPERTRIYHERVSRDRDVTPQSQADILRLQELRGNFYVVSVPDTTGFEIFVYASLFVVAYAMVKMSNLPIPSARSLTQESPNNQLSNRENQIRIGGRIPDMFGTNIATPDLIAVPYFVYENHAKVEYAEMCLGRGEYQFETVQSAYEIRDGDTLISEIDGARVEVYGPGKSAFGDQPDFTINGEIDEPIRTVKRVTAVNGQTLEPANANEVVYDYEVGVLRDFKIVADPLSSIDFTTDVAALDTVSISIRPLLVGQVSSSWSYWSSGKYVAGGYIELDTNPFVYWDGDTEVYVDALTELVVGSLVDVDFTILISSVPTRVYGRWIVIGLSTVGGKVHIQFNDPWLINPALTGYVGTSELVSLYMVGRYDSIDFSGTFLVDSVSAKEITLNAAQVMSANPRWYYRYGLPTTWADLGDPNLPWFYSLYGVVFNPDGGDQFWIGPFTVNLPDMGGAIANFVAPQGLYSDDGTTQYQIDVDVEIEFTPINVAGVPIGDTEVFTATIEGSNRSRAERAVSIVTDGLDVSSYYSVRARRTSLRNTLAGGVTVDEVKWADLYGTKLYEGPHFGNVTTIRAVTTATASALTVKSRKLSVRCTRKVKVLQTDNTLSSDLRATRRFTDILAHVCLDPYIGGRSANELDLENMRDTFDAIVDYFGTEEAASFSHTFDRIDMSFEETAALIASAAFCTVYREGSLIRTFFERANSSSTVLFNHRNKLPKSETRTYEFGVEGDYDGVDLEYTQPLDGVRTLYRIPTDLSAIKPKKVVTAGVAHPLLAYFHAWREWNRLQHRRVLTEFTATQEAELLLPNSKILVADNTRQHVQDGEVRSKSGLTIETSQPVHFEELVSYTIFLQYTDGTVQSMPVTAGVDEYHVVLDEEPLVSLSIDPNNYALTTYLIVRNDDSWVREFLVNEREVSEGMQSKVVAFNYDSRYYANDLDYDNGVIDEDGNPT